MVTVCSEFQVPSADAAEDAEPEPEEAELLGEPQPVRNIEQDRAAARVRAKIFFILHLSFFFFDFKQAMLLSINIFPVR